MAQEPFSEDRKAKTSSTRPSKCLESTFSLKTLKSKAQETKYSFTYLSYFLISLNAQSPSKPNYTQKITQPSPKKIIRNKQPQQSSSQRQKQLFSPLARRPERRRITNLSRLSQATQRRNNQSLLNKVATPLHRFYQQDGFPVEDFKFWTGLARKKFMGLNFVSLF